MRTVLVLAALGLAASARAAEPQLSWRQAHQVLEGAATVEWQALGDTMGALGRVVELGDPGGRLTAAHAEGARHTSAAWEALQAGDDDRAIAEMRAGWGAISPVTQDFLDRAGTNTALDVEAKLDRTVDVWLAQLAPYTGGESAARDLLDTARGLHGDAVKLRAGDPDGAFEKDREALEKIDAAFRVMAPPAPLAG